MGGKVEKFGGGWSVGPTEYDFGDRTYKLNAWHQDQVVKKPETQRSSPRPRCAKTRPFSRRPHVHRPAPPRIPEGVHGGADPAPGARSGPRHALLADATSRIETPLDSPSMADRIAEFFPDPPNWGRSAPDGRGHPNKRVTYVKWTDQLPEAARLHRQPPGRRSGMHHRRHRRGGARAGDARCEIRQADQYFLPNSIFLQTITGEWADNPFDAFTEPDMILEPDWSTATAAPWTADTTLQVIHDAKDQEGKPCPLQPRNVLRRIVELYAAQGWKPVVAPEMEFFLTARNIDPNQPVIPPMGRSGRRAAGKQTYSLSAIDEYGKVIDDIYDYARGARP